MSRNSLQAWHSSTIFWILRNIYVWYSLMSTRHEDTQMQYLIHAADLYTINNYKQLIIFQCHTQCITICDRIWEKGPFRAACNCSVHGKLSMVVVHMPNEEYFIIDTYGLFPTFCVNFRPTAHFLFSAEALKEENCIRMLQVYGLSPEMNMVASTKYHIQQALCSPFATLATR